MDKGKYEMKSKAKKGRKNLGSSINDVMLSGG